MIDQAVAHITAQALKEGSNFAIFIEEHLTSICTNDIVAGKLLNPEKSLVTFCKDVQSKARAEANKGRGNVRIVGAPDQVYHEQVEEYYGITDMDKSKDVKSVKGPATNVVNVLDFI
jgi:hypothetical protein